MAKYKKPSSNKKIIFLLASTVIVIIFANLIPKIQVYIKKPEAAALINFPLDHASHPNFKTEWWYLNLMTKTVDTAGGDEKDTAYLISLSRILNNNGLLTSSYDQTNKVFKQKTNTDGSLTVYLTDNKYLFAQYIDNVSNTTLQEKPPGTDRKRVYILTGKSPEIGNFNLKLKERTVKKSGYNTPLLWGGTTGNCVGKISVFGDNDTFYYSIPDLDITGTIIDTNGITRNVKIGKAWIDHQWFNSKPPSNWMGHYWNSFHFTESTNLYDTTPHHGIGFVTQMYSEGANITPKYTYWVKRNADGTNQCGSEGSITINNYGSTNYPSSWTIKLKKSGTQFMKITGSPFSENQIFIPPFNLPQFFEPASYYSGKWNGKPVTGLGFFETHLTKPQ